VSQTNLGGDPIRLVAGRRRGASLRLLRGRSDGGQRLLPAAGGKKDASQGLLFSFFPAVRGEEI